MFTAIFSIFTSYTLCVRWLWNECDDNYGVIVVCYRETILESGAFDVNDFCDAKIQIGLKKRVVKRENGLFVLKDDNI